MRNMRIRWLVLITLCSPPAFADKNRREAENVVTGIDDTLKHVGTVQQSSAGRRGDMDLGGERAGHRSPGMQSHDFTDRKQRADLHDGWDKSQNDCVEPVG